MTLQPALGLENLLQSIISPNKIVLDLGRFASTTTQALLKRRCQCFVEDLPEFIASNSELTDLEFEVQLKKYLTVINHNVAVDVILTWDLFHYLSLNQIEILFRLLRNKIKTGTFIHATRHTTANIPQRPREFRLLSDFSFEMHKPTSDKLVSNFSHSTISLLALLNDFSLNNTLTHTDPITKGIVEYSFYCGKTEIITNRLKTVQIVPAPTSNNPVTANEKFSTIKLPNLSKLLKQFDLTSASTNLIFNNSSSNINNKNLLLNLSNRVMEDDLYAQMKWQRNFSPDKPRHLGSQILNYPHEFKFDLVLLWDLLSFLNADQISALMQKFSINLKPGSLVHLVLPYSQGAPSKPANFKINANYEIEFQNAISGNIPIEVQSTGELVRLLAQFKISAYYFGSRNSTENYQEFLFEYRPRKQNV